MRGRALVIVCLPSTGGESNHRASLYDLWPCFRARLDVRKMEFRPVSCRVEGLCCHGDRSLSFCYHTESYQIKSGAKCLSLQSIDLLQNLRLNKKSIGALRRALRPVAVHFTFIALDCPWTWRRKGSVEHIRYRHSSLVSSRLAFFAHFEPLRED